MDYSKILIDRDFCVRNFKFYLSGCGFHNYVGFDVFVDVVGYSLSKRLVRELCLKGSDKLSRRLRRGLKVEIYNF